MFTPTLQCECAQPGLIDTMGKWSITLVVKDSTRLLLSPAIDNRLVSVINQLGSNTCYRYTICDSKSIMHSTAAVPS